MDLRQADLRQADLRQADLGGADLGGADLGGANLGGANLGGANLGGANLSAVTLDLNTVSPSGIPLYHLLTEPDAQQPLRPGLVRLTIPMSADEDIAEVQRVIDAIAALARLAVQIGPRLTSPDATGGDSALAAALGADDVSIRVQRVHYGSPLDVILRGAQGIEYLIALLVLMLVFPNTFREWVTTQRLNINTRMKIAEAENIRAGRTLQELQCPPISPEQAAANLEGSQADPTVIAEVSEALGEIGPMLERGFSIEPGDADQDDHADQDEDDSDGDADQDEDDSDGDADQGNDADEE